MNTITEKEYRDFIKFRKELIELIISKLHNYPICYMENLQKEIS